jgi:hypothetical protein
MSQQFYSIRLVDIWHGCNGDYSGDWAKIVPALSNYMLQYSLSLFRLGFVSTIFDVSEDIHPSTSTIQQHLSAVNATSAVGAKLWFTETQKQLLEEQHPLLSGTFVVHQVRPLD